MEHRSRWILAILALIFATVYVGVGYIVYQDNIAYAQEQNKKRLNEILWQQRALHRFVEETQKPVFYGLKKEGKLYEEFFDPRVLSFTFIARGIYRNLNEIRTDNNATGIYYKLATDNPRNPLNQATAEELAVLRSFRAGAKSDYSEILLEEGKRYIYYAMPIAPNKESCMRCHSTPDKAPAELLKRYGETAGFGENVGDIRAMISLKIPFESEYDEAMRHIKTVMGLLLLFLVSLYGAIFFFIRLFDRQQRIIKARNVDLQSQAERDGLTGVLNRRSFDVMFETCILNPSLVMVLIDIDHFKRINDTHGHLVGDDILRETAVLFRSHIRAEDRLFRVGGEEFVILSTMQSLEQIIHMTQRLLEAMAAHDFGIERSVTVSAGVTEKRPDDTTKSLYSRADEALYTSKSEGRNRYTVLS